MIEKTLDDAFRSPTTTTIWPTFAKVVAQSIKKSPQTGDHRQALECHVARPSHSYRNAREHQYYQIKCNVFWNAVPHFILFLNSILKKTFQTFFCCFDNETQKQPCQRPFRYYIYSLRSGRVLSCKQIVQRRVETLLNTLYNVLRYYKRLGLHSQ